MEANSKEIQERVSHLEKLLIDRTSTNQNHSVQFAVVLVANLMIINSGALFAFPNFVQKFSVANALSHYALYAAGFFVAGIVSATLCGYAAYWNFQAHAQLEAYQQNKTIFDVKFPGADYDLPALKKYADEIAKGIRSSTRLVKQTFIGGNLIGIASLIFFVVGCYFSGSIVFAQI
jgi:uncharacterized membrane protein YebE (DUF533 family)